MTDATMTNPEPDAGAWGENRQGTGSSRAAGACATCGYSLAGLAHAVVCPECGTRVDLSPAEMLLASPEHDVVRLGRGLLVTAAGGYGVVATAMLCAWAILTDSAWAPVLACGVALWVITAFAGIWLATGARILHVPKAERDRRSTRGVGVTVGVVAGAVLVSAALRWRLPSRLSEQVIVGGCLSAPVFFLAMSVGLLKYLERFAEASGDERVALRMRRRLHAAMWCGVIGMWMLFVGANAGVPIVVGLALVQAPLIVTGAACLEARRCVREFRRAG